MYFANKIYRRGDDDTHNISLGQRHVLQGRFLLTYRLVDTILVFYVCEPEANPFVCLRFVDAVGKMLVGISKGVDISSRRLSKRYADLHLLIGRLLSRGVGYFPPAFIHAPPTNEKLLSLPVSTFDASRKLKKIKKGKTKTDFVKTDSNKEEVPVTQEEWNPDNEYKVVWQKSGHASKSVNFHIPADALPPPPARVLGAKRQPPAPPRFVQPLQQHAFEGSMPVQSDEEMDVERQTVDEQETEDEKIADAAGLPDDMEKTGAPEVPISDLKESLVLVEIWEGDACQGVLRKASIKGEVRRALAPYGLYAAGFKLTPSNNIVLDTCLQTASVHRNFVSRRKDHSFMSKLTGVPIDASYLKYNVPLSTCNPPMQADLILVPSASPNSSEVLVILRYALNPDLSKGLVDVAISLDMPPEVPNLVKTSEKAKWSPTECRILWELDLLPPGASGSIQAVFRANGPLQSPSDIFSQVKAHILFSGWPGSSFSGLGFQISLPEEEEYHKGRIRTFGSLTLRL